MAKSVSTAPVYPGSIPPQAPTTRHAAPERWDKPFSAEMQEVDVDLVLAHPLFINTNPKRFPASIPLRAASSANRVAWPRRFVSTTCTSW